MAATRWMPGGMTWIAAVVVFAAHAATVAAEPSPEQLEFFEKKIRPVLVQRCYKCHAEGDDLKGGLRLDTREGLLHGGNSGPAVMPGKPAESQLLLALEYETFEMPPDAQLPADVIADFHRWIEMGAPDPRVTAIAAPVLTGYQIDPEVVRNHWAFQPPRAHAAPANQDASWPLDDVDRFVLAQLESAKLPPTADANRSTWLRRVSLDLTGLLPTVEEQHAFEIDDQDGAHERVVDRLLASPRFGERWGRHWLDVARYGDSTGKERNAPYLQAWLYRNWVIDAHNADEPYDAFLRAQLAGDLLPATSEQQRRSQLTATGFLAVGIKSVNETIPDAYMLDIVDEQIDVVGRSMLGLSIACARCHDHKFDPIPTKDYYALAGIFGSTEVLDGVIRRPRISSRVDRLMPTAMQNADLSESFARLDHLEDEWTKTHHELGRVRHKFPKQVRQLRFERRHLEMELDETAQSIVEDAGENLVMAVADRGQPVDMAVRVRGETFALGPVVPRGVLTILDGVPAGAMPEDSSGRLELANWITHRDNPLTARVAVNRVWAHLFGEGLVRSGDDFGLQAEPPTHPELLDTLAVNFMEDGWSIKRLIRRLVLSRTYRQASAAGDAQHLETDGDNRTLWRFSRRRLESEAIRDVMLAASGQLAFERPGESLMLEFGTTELESDTDVGRLVRESRYRSVYLPMPRGLLPEMMQIFDQADPSLVVTQRDATGSPPQALFLLNSPFVIAQARALARRLLNECDDDVARIELAYRLTMARAPTSAERRAIDAFLIKSAAGDGQPLEETWTTIAQTLLALPEFRFVL